MAAVRSMELFLGIELTPELNAVVPATSPHVQNDPDPRYLHRMTREGKEYLGKVISDHIPTSSLDLIAENIYSLLSQVVPEWDWSHHRLVLVPYDG